MECVASENDSKISNISEENRTKDDSDKLNEPSECKIPKTDVSETKSNEETSEVIEVKVVYNKKKYDVSAPSNTSIADFKKQLQGLLGIPDSMQKLMYKGLLQDSQTLSSSGITKGSKIMLVGSTLNDVLAVSSVSKQVSG
jgi:hypothetical protein